MTRWLALALLSLTFAASGIRADAPPLDDIFVLQQFHGADRDNVNLLLTPQEVSPIVRFDEKCCKVCTKGKACGNSCINRDYQCHQPPGCACDG